MNEAKAEVRKTEKDMVGIEKRLNKGKSEGRAGAVKIFGDRIPGH